MKFCGTIALFGIVSWGSTIATAHVDSAPLRVMTFNIRYGSAPDGENAWPKRRHMVLDVVRQFNPDVLGLQEALRMQLDEIGEQFPQYILVGAGRESDGGGEYSSILFRRGRFDLWASGTFWLSETPDTPGSTSWGNQLPRICTWVRLQDRRSGFRFYVFNTHWDHKSEPARVGAGRLIADRVAALGTAEPAVVMGDFNAGEASPARAPLVEIGLRDAFRDLHTDATKAGTFHGFRGGSQGKKVDAIFVDRHWKVDAATIDHFQRDGRYPSDHFPVTAVLRAVDLE